MQGRVESPDAYSVISRSDWSNHTTHVMKIVDALMLFSPRIVNNGGTQRKVTRTAVANMNSRSLTNATFSIDEEPELKQ